LEALKNKEDVGLGAMLALVSAHKKFSSVGEYKFSMIYFSLER
jgi:hypothetical protein